MLKCEHALNQFGIAVIIILQYVCRTAFFSSLCMCSVHGDVMLALRTYLTAHNWQN